MGSIRDELLEQQARGVTKDGRSLSLDDIREFARQLDEQNVPKDSRFTDQVRQMYTAQAAAAHARAMDSTIMKQWLNNDEPTCAGEVRPAYLERKLNETEADLTFKEAEMLAWMVQYCGDGRTAYEELSLCRHDPKYCAEWQLKIDHMMKEYDNSKGIYTASLRTAMQGTGQSVFKAHAIWYDEIAEQQKKQQELHQGAKAVGSLRARFDSLNPFKRGK